MQDLTRRQVSGKTGVLRKVSDPAEDRTIANGLAQKPDFTLIRIGDGERDLDECCLARAVGAEQSEDRSGLDDEAYISESVNHTPRPPLAERLRERNGFKDHGHGPGLYRGKNPSSLAAE